MDLEIANEMIEVMGTSSDILPNIKDILIKVRINGFDCYRL